MRRRADLLLPACGEKVGMRGRFRQAQNRGNAPSPAALRAATSPRAAGRGAVGRGDFITLIGGAAATWPLAVRAQQPAMPVIGFLHIGTADAYTDSALAAFRRGLQQAGYVEAGTRRRGDRVKRRADLLLPACGEKVGMRGPLRLAQNRGNAPSPAALRATTSPRAAGRGAMHRRSFITMLGGAAATWPLVVRAQQAERIRRVGVLVLDTENAPNNKETLARLRENLAQLGWIEGRNVRLDVRFADGDPDRLRPSAVELVGLAPEVIFVQSAPATIALQQLTQTIPIVFVNVGDPVGQGIVKSIARPDGNITGFTNLFASVAGKCVNLLKDAVPAVARLALIFNPRVYVFEDYLAEIESAAAARAVRTIRTPVSQPAEIERAVDAFAAEPNGALYPVPPPLSYPNVQLVLKLAVERKLPTIFPARNFARDGGLIGYGPNNDELIRGASSYVDRILRGTKVGDLPVQFPTKFDLVINLKTAKALGLEMPHDLLVLADEVIE